MSKCVHLRTIGGVRCGLGLSKDVPAACETCPKRAEVRENAPTRTVRRRIGGGISPCQFRRMLRKFSAVQYAALPPRLLGVATMPVLPMRGRFDPAPVLIHAMSLHAEPNHGRRRTPPPSR